VTLHAACSAVAVALWWAGDVIDVIIAAHAVKLSLSPNTIESGNNPCIQMVMRIAIKI